MYQRSERILRSLVTSTMHGVHLRFQRPFVAALQRALRETAIGEV